MVRETTQRERDVDEALDELGAGLGLWTAAALLAGIAAIILGAVIAAEIGNHYVNPELNVGTFDAPE